MSKYRVPIIIKAKSQTTDIIVEADSVDEAWLIAEEMIYEGEVELDCLDIAVYTDETREIKIYENPTN